MNYLQRLIKRAQARPMRRRDSIDDPFSKVEYETALWPTTNPPQRVPGVETTPEQSLTSDSRLPPPQVEVKPNRELTAKADSATQASPVAELEAPSSLHRPAPSQADDELATQPDILNKNTSISIIDEIMEPFIQSAAPELALPAPQKPPQKSTAANSEIEPSGEIKTLSPQPAQPIKANNREAPETAPVSIQSLQPGIEASIISPATKVGKKLNSKDRDHAATDRSRDETPQQKQKIIIERQNKVVVVSGSSQTVNDLKSSSGGSPHIGLGQL